MALSLIERDKKVIWHPYTSQKYAADVIPVVKGEGVWLFDDKGSKYIDAISSWWVNIHGHSHPYIAEAIYKQALALEQVIFAGFTHEPAVQLAERLVQILPGNFTRIFYSDNGSTATEVAIKMAIQYWWNQGNNNRTRILALTNSYHGDTFGAMSVSDRGIFTLAFQDRLFDVLFAEIPQPGKPFCLAGYSEEESGNLLADCACIIYEPLLQGAGGMMMYDAEALNNLLKLCKKHDVICIADEVLTGFGRTGKLFSSMHVEEQPDIICLSKGLTGGFMALGVTACTKKVHDAFVQDDKLKTFFHGHSFTANPIACAAALASLDLLLKEETKQRIERICTQHQHFAERLNKEKEELNIENIRLCGTIVAFEIAEPSSGYTSSVRDVFTAMAIEQSVYLRPLGNTVYIMPPYCISEEELDLVYAVVMEISKKLKVKSQM